MAPRHVRKIISSPQTFTGMNYKLNAPLCILHAVWNFYTCKCTEEDWFNLFMHWNMMYDKTWQCLMILLMCYTDWKMYFLHAVKNHFLRLYFKIHTNMIDFAVRFFFLQWLFIWNINPNLTLLILYRFFYWKENHFMYK